MSLHFSSILTTITIEEAQKVKKKKKKTDIPPSLNSQAESLCILHKYGIHSEPPYILYREATRKDKTKHLI